MLFVLARAQSQSHRNVADINLTATALYCLPDIADRRRPSSPYSTEAVRAILEAAKTKRVGKARAAEIAKSLRQQHEPQSTGKEPAPGSQSSSVLAPPTALTSQRGLPPPDDHLRGKFAAVVLELERLATKSSASFSGVIPAARLEKAANFLNQIAGLR